MESRTRQYSRLEAAKDEINPQSPAVDLDVESQRREISQRIPGNPEAQESLLNKSPPLICRSHLIWVLTAVVFLLVGFSAIIPVVMVVNGHSFGHHRKMVSLPPPPSTPLSPSPSPEGVHGGGLGEIYRTAFHFQPTKNWMNDPNGPMYFNGFYHLFYQYNPFSAIWGNITWGHAVSKDLIHWDYLPLALQPDQWYDIKGVWSGSVTIVTGTPIISYTGNTKFSAQTQNIAVPKNISDPYLREWIKGPENPIAEAPKGVLKWDFRDPSTAWKGGDEWWRFTLGARKNGVDMSLVYRSRDFKNWELFPTPLRTAPARKGMWECPDFYPVSLTDNMGVETSVNGLGVLHVLKASFDDSRNDYYSLGVYEEKNETWVPIDPKIDVENGPRYDYGRFYASKTFFDPIKSRRILFGWVNESDSQEKDVLKGWSSVLGIPRTLWLDGATGKHLIQLPVDEVRSLRNKKVSVTNVTVEGGEVLEIKSANGMQLDVEVSFLIPKPTKKDAQEAENLLSSGVLNREICSSRGSQQNNVIGPFGISVLSTENLLELTPIYFEMIPLTDGKWETRVCSDQSRSSLAPDSDRSVYGIQVRVLPSDQFLTLRVLVDRSIVETFAQGGRAVMTSRVYPTRAVNLESKLFVFNNGSVPITVHTLDSWQMSGMNAQFV